MLVSGVNSYIAHQTSKEINIKGNNVGHDTSTSFAWLHTNFCKTICLGPKAALLFWFFGGFRCGVPLFIIIFVIY